MNAPHRLGLLLILVSSALPGLRLGAAGVAEGELPSTLSTALVRVELFVQADRGEEPQAAGWNKRCPKCGSYHDNALDDALVDERPVVVAGFLVAPDRVLTSDPLIQSRFVQRWQVRIGDEVLPARPAAWALDRPAMLLALERAAPVKPLVFSSKAKEPLYTIHQGDEGNGWGMWVQPHQASGWLLQDGVRQRTATAGALIVDAAGEPVAISMSDRMPAGEGWREAYAAWPWMEHVAYEAALERTRQNARALFLKAELELRALPVKPGEEHGYRGDDAEQKLKGVQTAVVLSPRRVLVLTSLMPSQTARLTSVRLTLADGSTVNATFVGSSDEYGALVVDPGRDLPVPVALSEIPWETLRDRMLLTADVRLTGEERVVHCAHLRLASIKPGYKNRAVPTFAGRVEATFFFDSEGRLAGLPMTRRIKAKRDNWESASTFVVAARDVARFNGEASLWADARNRPLSEAESRQLAWLGVDLQPLDADLALTHGVAEQTDNGSHGALVTHVYADSPAARNGLRTGDIVIRMQPEGAAKPIEIEVERYAFSDQPFPWERYDEINEAYFDRIPRPWLPAENALHVQLKDFGVGSSYRLDYARDGRVASLDLKVEAGPTHFMTAPEVIREDLGFRLRELTFETRRYYQLADDMTALVVAKVEAGGAAAVAGLKPYELITTINDQPVGTVAEFEKAVAGGGVLRFGIRRMNQNRVVVVDAAAMKKR
jgi:S1-C subfamily serine protease